MNRRRGRMRRIAGRAVLLTCACLFSQGAARGEIGRFFGSIEANYVRPQFSMDTTVHVEGVPMRFFTGRPDHYAGWRFQIRSEGRNSRRSGFGKVASGGIWQSRYWLNWELPSIGVSVDPIRTRLIGCYVDVGLHAYRRIGRFRVMPSASLPIGLTRFALEFPGGFTESAWAIHTGITPGLEVGVALGGRMELTLGHRRTFALPTTPGYSVEPKVRLHGKFEGGPAEYFLGLTLGPDLGKVGR